MTKLNKLKGFGFDWMVVRSEGDLSAIIPKVKISLTLSRYYYKASRNKI